MEGERPSGTCPVCRKELAAESTELTVGPLKVTLCKGCSQLGFHLMGLYQWLSQRSQK